MLQLPKVKQSQLPTYPDFCMTLTWTINGAISVMDHQQPPRLNGEEEKLDSKWEKVLFKEANIVKKKKCRLSRR